MDRYGGRGRSRSRAHNTSSPTSTWCMTPCDKRFSPLVFPFLRVRFHFDSPATAFPNAPPFCDTQTGEIQPPPVRLPKTFFFLLEFKKICVETGLLQAAVRKPPEFSRISLFVLLKFAGFYEKKKKIRAADSHGWVLRYDLNKGTSGNYVYLCYRLGFLDGPEEPVTDIVICADTTRTGAGTRPPGPGTLLPPPPPPRSPDQILL